MTTSTRSAKRPKTAPAPRRGVVLGAGGVLGAAWTIGALSALRNATGIEPGAAEVVVGTSAGSVLSALAASGVNVEMMVANQLGIVVEGAPELEYDHDTSSGGALPPRPRLRLGSAGLLRASVLHPRRLTPTARLASLLPEGRGTLGPLGAMIDAVAPAAWPTAPRPWIVAMDYDTGKRVVFGREGSPEACLRDAVLASCSIPGWYAPVEINGRRYVDGGTCSATSLDLLAPLGLDEVYVLAPMAAAGYDSPGSLAGRLERRFRHAVTRRLEREAAKVRATGTRVTILAPGAADLTVIGANLMDPRRREATFRTAQRTTATALRELSPAAGALAAAG